MSPDFVCHQGRAAPERSEEPLEQHQGPLVKNHKHTTGSNTTQLIGHILGSKTKSGRVQTTKTKLWKKRMLDQRTHPWRRWSHSSKYTTPSLKESFGLRKERHAPPVWSRCFAPLPFRRESLDVSKPKPTEQTRTRGFTPKSQHPTLCSDDDVNVGAVKSLLSELGQELDEASNETLRGLNL